ncbi:MAG: dihydroorotate dehydrogenase-like protein [Bacteroidales bacterium]|nr:dihydroorotate dehydrogenase-like protein [Deltaproteobacteria bacterium]MBN2667072.1 dihydroorotate dehydrogenase-like protein [Bacteroidales bacterium]
MEKLTTKYLGLTLRSPLIVSSSRLTSTLGHLKEAEDNGAGAVVLKSLFEEQINYYVHSVSSQSDYPEADDYVSNYIHSNSVDNYLEMIRQAKKNLSIPVIPSINCYTAKGWTGFARNIAEAGADALEINVFFLPVDRKLTSAESEKLYFELIENIKKTVKIPVALKIGFRFSNILYMIDQFYNRGVNGVVMFNRFYEPDIDIDKLEIIPASVLSQEIERRYVLRWIGMTSAQKLKIDISASTGVHSGQDAVKYILAGANSVQVCSALYNKGIGYLKTMNQQIAGWMESKGLGSIDDFRGKLNYANYDKPRAFERTQFMKYFSSYE